MQKVNRILGLLTIAAFLAPSASLARMTPREIYKAKANGVVLIVASQEGSSSASAGTGSIVAREGKDALVITNSHVVFDATAKAPFPVIHIFMKPERVTGYMNRDLTRHFAAELVAHDPTLDLALLRMKDAPGDAPVISLGDPEEVGPGDDTIAIGHPEQGGLWTITTGVIGAEFADFKGVPGKDVFQMETSLNRGNSGGPLFDVRGFQVGVNTAIARQGQGGIAITGVNFALKASVAKKWLEKNRVTLAYGREPAAADTRVAAAEPAREAPPAAGPGETHRDPAGQGSLTVEAGEGEVAAAASADEGEE
ncbi:MAG TPA: trypsin-like peptidase domain-containing protein, partial [Myxococcota bacterium]|nr:trypsin-like peptidase domain-containing protein [Myxococcota bacterium]